MRISVNVDVDGVVKLAAAVLRQLPYATNNAITRTAKAIVETEKAEIVKVLQPRTKFAQNRIQILQYSKVNNLTAIVGVNTNVKGSAVLLGFLLSDGGEKRPEHGASFAEALTGTAARPTFGDKIPRKLLYKQLQITEHTTNTGKIQLKGKQRTFVLGKKGIFQRTGPGKSDYSLIYFFAGAAYLRPRTSFSKIAIAVIDKYFAKFFSEEFTKEILKKAQRGS